MSSNLGNLSDDDGINAIGKYLMVWFPIDLQPEEMISYIKPDEDVNFGVIKWSLPSEKFINNIPNQAILEYPIENYLKKTLSNFIEFRDVYNGYFIKHITDKSEFMARSFPLFVVRDEKWQTDLPFTFQDVNNKVNAFYIRVIIEENNRKTYIELRESIDNTSSVIEEGYIVSISFRYKTITVSSSGAIKLVKISIETICHPNEQLILADSQGKIFISSYYFNNDHSRHNAIIKARLNPRLPYSIDDALPNYIIEHEDAIASGTAYIIELYRDGIEPSQTSENYTKFKETYQAKNTQKTQFEKVNEYNNNKFSTNSIFSGGYNQMGRFF